jgi:hypothetical protein
VLAMEQKLKMKDNGSEGYYELNPYPTIGRQEITPSATSESVKPLKYDEGKHNPALVPPMFIRVLARIFEYGLTKYYKDSWKQFTLDKAIDDLIPAAMRHIDDYRSGEYLDPVTERPHLGHAAWNLLIVLWHSEPDKDAYR